LEKYFIHKLIQIKYHYVVKNVWTIMEFTFSFFFYHIGTGATRKKKKRFCSVAARNTVKHKTKKYPIAQEMTKK